MVCPDDNHIVILNNVKLGYDGGALLPREHFGWPPSRIKIRGLKQPKTFSKLEYARHLS